MHNFVPKDMVKRIIQSSVNANLPIIKKITGNNEPVIRLCPDFDIKDEKGHDK